MSTLDARTALEDAYRADKRRVLATLIRLLGSFDAAEEAVHLAFIAAAEDWPRRGVPANPYSWLVSAGRFRTLDRWRKQARIAGAVAELTALADEAEETAMRETIQDDELRLILTCCHPILPPDARIALTLREVGGLTTEAIARAYLTTPPTVAQRIVRAKARIRDAAIPYQVPDETELPERLESALNVIYLIFNEGYAAAGGPAMIRADLCAEAIRLGRLMAGLLDHPEAHGLLALMLIQDARRDTRTDAEGNLVLLEDQDRSQWRQAPIAEAQGLISSAMRAQRPGFFLVQAAIAALHAQAPDTGQTDWPQIVMLYDTLLRIGPSPVVALNRAVAIAMRDGPDAGLRAVDAAMADGSLDLYHLAHAARADMLRRLDRRPEAAAAYRTAFNLARQPAERRFLEGRLAALAVDG